MIRRILEFFPEHVHALTLVSDPDALLADEAVLTALAERGFRLLNERDPVRLRLRMQEAGVPSVEQPQVIVTSGELRDLPYDLWQQGHHVTLALHTFFPNLSYPLVVTLSPAQRSRLNQVPAPTAALGRQATAEFILRHAFGVEPVALRQPGTLIGWLNNYHQMADPMPEGLAQGLLQTLRAVPEYERWPLEEILLKRDAFTHFVREQWRGFVQQETGQLVSQETVSYVVDFRSEGLQDTISRLVRSGAVAPLQVKDPEVLPRWARPAVLAPTENRQQRRAGGLLGLLQEKRSGWPQQARWSDWQELARAWAEMSDIRHDPAAHLEDAQRRAYDELLAWNDDGFGQWLRENYALLGGQRLPVPHHVHHVPEYLAFRRREGQARRVALLVLDGLALSDWMRVGATWRARHPGWSFEERLVLAQIPTQTAISRQALISGLRPAEFAATLYDNAAEPRLWTHFWARQEFPASACSYCRLSLPRIDPPAELDDPRLQAVCLVYSRIDELAHDSTLGASDMVQSLQLWLEKESPGLEALLDRMLTRGYELHIASDHGHVQACGMGQPSEGVLVQSRGQRSRLYAELAFAQATREAFPSTILWRDDGLLPPGVCALIPKGRQAFAPPNQIVVTHGGLTIEEMVVPLVTITES